MEEVMEPFTRLVHDERWPSTLIAKMGEFNDGV